MMIKFLLVMIFRINYINIFVIMIDIKILDIILVFEFLHQFIFLEIEHVHIRFDRVNLSQLSLVQTHLVNVSILLI